MANLNDSYDGKFLMTSGRACHKAGPKQVIDSFFLSLSELVSYCCKVEFLPFNRHNRIQ